MSFTDKIKAIISCAVLAGIFEAIYLQQQFFWIIIAPVSLAFLLAFLWILGPDFFRRKRLKMKKMVLPLLILVGVTFFLLFEPTKFLRQVVIILSIAAFWLFFTIYRKIPAEDLEEKELDGILNLLTFLCTFSAFLDFWVIYNVYYAFALSLWVSMLMVLVVSFALFAYLFWATGIYAQFLLPFAILLGVTLLEIFLVLSFWPTDPATKSLILVLFFYTLLGLTVTRAKKELNRKKVLEYLVLFCFFFLLIILTMKWYPMI
jgi:hypothetical protein